MNNLCAIYIISLAGCFNWRTTLLKKLKCHNIVEYRLSSSACRNCLIKKKEVAKKNRLIWFAGFVGRFCVILVLTSLFMHFVGRARIHTWSGLLALGPAYILVLWFLNMVFSFLIEEPYIQRKYTGHTAETDISANWWKYWFALVVIWMVLLVVSRLRILQ